MKEKLINLVFEPKKIAKIFMIMGAMIAIGTLLGKGALFWDLDVYLQAVDLQINNKNPYQVRDGLKFVYAPYVLLFFSFWKSNFIYFLLCFYAFAFFVFMKNKLGRELFFYSLVSLPIFFYDQYFIFSIVTGNITFFLHLFIIGIAASKIKRKKVYFLLIVSLSAMIKPYMFAYVLLGIAIWKKDKIYFKYATITTLITIAIFISQIFVTPDLFNGFMASLKAQTIGVSMAGPGKDVGLAPYWFLAHFFTRETSLLLHFLLVVLFSCGIIYLYNRFVAPYLVAADSEKVLLLIFIIVVTLLNPRMKVYDYWLLMGASTVSIFIFFNYLPKIKFIVILFVILSINAMFFFARFYFKMKITPFMPYLPLVYLIRVAFIFYYQKKLIKQEV